MTLADDDARDAACLLAIDPAGLQGAIVRGPSLESCEAWLDALATLLPTGAPVRRIPGNTSTDRLLGGLDIAATLATGRVVSERGVLAAADAGAVVLTAATARAATCSHVARVLDTHEVLVERDGITDRHSTTFAAIAFETAEDDGRDFADLTDRAAFIVQLGATSRGLWSDPLPAHAVMAARERAAAVRCSDASLEALCRGADQMGITSTRVVLRACAAARASAALDGRSETSVEDLRRAARLVFAPRAGRAQPAESSPQPPAPSQPTPAGETAEEERPQGAGAPDAAGTDDAGTTMAELTDIVVHSAQSALPPSLLAGHDHGAGRAEAHGGRAGREREGGTHGRKVGTRRGDPRTGGRLDIIATLRAAAPMQRLRRAARSDAPRLVELRRDDFRVARHVTPSTTTTVFVVDASGSSALNRLAEAKGAMELLLAEGYARRDRVALIAFRGRGAELVLPPTHALARARRAIAGLAAGGGTPLASALDLAARVVLDTRRDGAQVATVILSDGRANVARDGSGGRARAEHDALDASQRFQMLGGTILFIDTSPRPDAFARRVATALGARYVPLPAHTARGVSDLARAARDLSAH